MGNKKIVFVFNAILTRCVKRVEEFIENGYEVEVYAFGRGGTPYVQPHNFKINIIGEHDVNMSYLKRSIIIRKSLSRLFKKHRNDNVTYYFFFYDVASVAYFLCRKPYIYEESDMPYTNIRYSYVRKIMEILDRLIIRHSLVTTMTSSGFAEYHYGSNIPSNIIVVPNRVNEKLLYLPYTETKTNISHLRFAFVGGFRYKTTLNFIIYGAKHFPQHTFSIYGNIMNHEEEIKKLSKTYNNVIINGIFKNPEDLPAIYASTDLVLANYDATTINAQYAEPNKLYESIFFHKPIIVSEGTYLAQKVKKMGIGYAINSDEETEVINFIQGLTEADLLQKQENCRRVPRDLTINKNSNLFDYLKKKGV